MSDQAPSAHASTTSIDVVLNINGAERRVNVPPQWTLLDVLTRSCGLTGPREGCGVGMCGACTVLVDGAALSACLLLAFQVEGREIVTIEGLADAAGRLHPVQEAFLEHTSFQCSYCTPGFILTTVAYLREPPAHRIDAKRYLSGNLCRCGSYVKILAAVKALEKRGP